MNRLFALFLASMLCAGAWAKPRVASLNMCTDQLVLALADDEQIVGLSSLSRDKVLSYFRERAAAFPQLSGTAEDALVLKPDLVVTAAFARPLTRSLLKASQIRLETFEDARNLSDVKEQITRMGAALEQSERARQFVQAIDKAASTVAGVGASGTILPIERRGWVTGRDTLLSNLLEIVGYRNMGAQLAEYGALVPLEKLVTLQPDRILLSQPIGRAEDQGAALLLHPALRPLLATSTIHLPDHLTVCAGPMVAEALETLARAARAP